MGAQHDQTKQEHQHAVEKLNEVEEAEATATAKVQGLLQEVERLSAAGASANTQAAQPPPASGEDEATRELCHMMISELKQASASFEERDAAFREELAESRGEIADSQTTRELLAQCQDEL